MKAIKNKIILNKMLRITTKAKVDFCMLTIKDKTHKMDKLKYQLQVIYNLILMIKALIFIKLSLNKIQIINSWIRIQCQIKIMEF